MTTTPRFFTLALCLLLLGGCGGVAKRPPAEVYRPPPPAAGRTVPGTVVPRTQLPYVVFGRTYYPLPSAEGFVEEGVASWYGGDFNGRRTACGEVYDMLDNTAAHKTLPMHTMLAIRNLENGRETVVRVNDRGPFVKDRIIDLSLTAARDLNLVGNGTAQVRITALGEAVTLSRNNKKYEEFLPHQDFTRGDFYVQVGSFTNPANARRLQEKIQGSGREVVIQPYNDGVIVFYRVHIKAGDTLAAAKEQEKLLADSGLPGFVVAH